MRRKGREKEEQRTKIVRLTLNHTLTTLSLFFFFSLSHKRLSYLVVNSTRYDSSMLMGGEEDKSNTSILFVFLCRCERRRRQ